MNISLYKQNVHGSSKGDVHVVYSGIDHQGREVDVRAIARPQGTHTLHTQPAELRASSQASGRFPKQTSAVGRLCFVSAAFRRPRRPNRNCDFRNSPCAVRKQTRRVGVKGFSLPLRCCFPYKQSPSMLTDSQPHIN